MAKLIAFTALMFLLIGCAEKKDAPAASSSFCVLAEPHFHSQNAQDAMTDQELAREQTHNNLGSHECGWKPNS